MTRKLPLILTTLFLLTPLARADAPLAADSSVDQILDALHDRGVAMKDFTADVSMAEIDNASGDATTHSGKITFQKVGTDGDARLKIAFSKRKIGNRSQPEDHVYVLDHGQLIERDNLKKSEVDRQVIKPGQKVNLLKLGEGPFPLPVGQDKADVKREFDVTKLAPAKDDPADAVHLQLTPKPQTKLARQFKTIDVWVDDATGMPKRIATTDPNAATDRQTDLSGMTINPGVGDGDFTLPPRGAGDWNVVNEDDSAPQ